MNHTKFLDGISMKQIKKAVSVFVSALIMAGIVTTAPFTVQAAPTDWTQRWAKSREKL